MSSHHGHSRCLQLNLSITDSPSGSVKSPQTLKAFLAARGAGVPAVVLTEQLRDRLVKLGASVSAAIKSEIPIDEYQELQQEKYDVRLIALVLLAHASQNDFATGSTPDNMPRNRYRNILPRESTRFRFRGGDKYINANDIAIPIGDGHPLQLVMSQAPLDTTSELFWQMAVEKRCCCIVMLTTEFELGRPKSHAYWPKVAGEELTFGAVTVRALDVVDGEAYVSSLHRITIGAEVCGAAAIALDSLPAVAYAGALPVQAVDGPRHSAAGRAAAAAARRAATARSRPRPGAGALQCRRRPHRYGLQRCACPTSRAGRRVCDAAGDPAAAVHPGPAPRCAGQLGHFRQRGSSQCCA